MKDIILDKLKLVEGKVGFYYKNLITGEIITYQHEEAFEAASVIKIPILIEVYRKIMDGSLHENQIFQVKEDDKLPSCGALTYMHTGLEVTLKDLCTLMIILSDNTATNMLIKLVGMDQINETMRGLGLKKTKVNRLLFDSKQSALGIQNYITPGEIRILLEKMYDGSLISKEASKEMISILMNQRLNGKIPFYITDGTKVAHKTGEDSGITHDVGIVFTKEPFIVCFCSNNVEVPYFERVIQEISRDLIYRTI